MAAVTVREVLTLPVLAGSTVVAGAEGLGSAVSGVNVMEVPDIESFVKSGELMLTTAYPLRDHPEDLGDLVGPSRDSGSPRSRSSRGGTWRPSPRR